MPTLRPLRTALTLTACLLTLVAALTATASAKTTRSRKSSCVTTTKPSHDAKRSSSARCVKSSRKRPLRKHAVKHKKKSASGIVFVAPATCEDGSQPVREDGVYSCEDGSEPICENGSSPVFLSSNATPMCRLRPGEEGSAAGSECEAEGGECATVEWSCEEEDGKSTDCEEEGESAGDEEAEG